MREAQVSLAADLMPNHATDGRAAQGSPGAATGEHRAPYGTDTRTNRGVSATVRHATGRD